MKKNQILLLVFLMGIFSVFAQEKKGMVHLEVTDANNTKKEIDAKCFVLSIIKANSTFAVVLFDKTFITNAKQIKAYLGQQQKAEAAVVTIPINDENVVQSGKLAGIPYLTIKQQAQNIILVKPTFFPEELLLQTMKGVTDKELEDFKLQMEKWAGY